MHQFGLVHSNNQVGYYHFFQQPFFKPHRNNIKFLCLQWVPEITHHCQKTPFLLVGTQIDLRDDAATIEKLAKNKQKPLSLEMGEKLAKELRAVKYVECSALTQVKQKIMYAYPSIL